MKLSTKLLLGLIALLLAGLLATNISMTRDYDHLDKSDPYWTFGKILTEPFKYLKIEGGNITNIAFEQNLNPSVRVYKGWNGYSLGSVKASVKNDTLYVSFPNNFYSDVYEENWAKNMTLVRIFAPQLLYVEGFDTKFDIFKLRQKNVHMHLHGRSSTEIESNISDFDSLSISESDSSNVYFEMSPDWKGSKAMHVQSLDADLHGESWLGLGHAQINAIKLSIGDSSAIELSGATLKTMNHK